MVRRTRRTVTGRGIESRVTIENAILGAPNTSDNATVRVNKSNPLSSRLSRSDGARPVRARRADLRSIIGAEQIDILKVDIEGPEFALVEAEAATPRQARILLLKVHAAPPNARDRLIAQGYHIRSNSLFAGDEHALLTKG